MRIAVAAASFAFFAAALPAHAGPAEEKFVAASGAQVTAALDGGGSETDRGNRAYSALSQSVDLERVALFTLGRHARTMSEDQKIRFVQAFENHVRSLYAKSFAAVGDGAFAVTGSVDRSPGDSVVSTRVDAEDGPVEINWRVNDTPSGRKIVDVQYGGVWLAVQKRADIAALFDRNGGDADKVIAALRAG